MTVFGTPFGGRGAAAELARLLDSGAALATAAPAGSPAQLAGVALRLQALAPALAATATPRAEFRDALRTRLVAVASVQAAGAPATPVRSPVRLAGLEAAVSWSRAVRAGRGVGIAVGAMASVVVVAGVGTAGTRSLPGDPFYGVKRAVEGLELRTADGALERGTTHLEHAGTRLDEVAALTRGRDAVALVGSGPVAGPADASLLVETLDDMDTATRAAARLLVEAAEEDGTTAPLERLTTFAVQQDRRLTALVPELPLVAQTRAAGSLALVDEVGDDALALLLDELPAAPLDPAVPAPAVPPAPAPQEPLPAAPPSGTGTEEQPAPGAPAPARTPAPAAPDASSPSDAPAASADGDERPAPAPAPSATRTPAPQPTLRVPVPVSSVPVPLPVPVPVPTAVEVPVPALPLPQAPVAPQAPSAPLPPAVPGAVGGAVEGAVGGVARGLLRAPTAVASPEAAAPAASPAVSPAASPEAAASPAPEPAPAPAPRPGARPVAP